MKKRKTNDLTNDLVKEIRKTYFKDWRMKNKDKVKQYNARYWKKRAEQIKQNSTND